jgi:hypothetical protein
MLGLDLTSIAMRGQPALVPPAGTRFVTETIAGVTCYLTKTIGGVTYYLVEAV